jgi:hypothetical protein
MNNSSNNNNDLDTVKGKNQTASTVNIHQGLVNMDRRLQTLETNIEQLNQNFHDLFTLLKEK